MGTGAAADPPALGGRNLILAGMMGCGKSTVGRALAARLGRPFVDTDELIVAAAGCDIPTIFAREGEAGFRAREKSVVAAVAVRTGLVVATGGGTLIDPDNRRRLRSGGVLVTLWAPPEVLLRRVGGGGRPLLEVADPLSRLGALLAEREAAYRDVDLVVDTASLPVEDVVEEVLRRIDGAR